MKTKLDTMNHVERAAFGRDLYRKDGNTAVQICWRLFLKSFTKGGK